MKKKCYFEQISLSVLAPSQKDRKRQVGFQAYRTEVKQVWGASSDGRALA